MVNRITEHRGARGLSASEQRVASSDAANADVEGPKEYIAQAAAAGAGKAVGELAIGLKAASAEAGSAAGGAVLSGFLDADRAPGQVLAGTGKTSSMGVPPSFRNLGVPDILPISTGEKGLRYLHETLFDSGWPVDNELVNGAYLDAYDGFRGACEFGHRHITFPYGPYYFRAPLGSNDSDAINELNSVAMTAWAPGLTGPPTIVFTDNTSPMFLFGPYSRNVAMLGNVVCTYQRKPTGGSVRSLNFDGAANIEIDRLAILNATVGARFVGGTRDVHIRHLHVEADQAIIADATVRNIVIWHLTGSGARDIAAGAGVTIILDQLDG